MNDDEATRDERRQDDAKGEGECAINNQPIHELISVLYCPGNSELAKC